VLSGPIDLRLTSTVVGTSIHYLGSVGSTNDELLRLAEEGARAGTVVLADEQRSGRGRSGREWQSPAGHGLWFSVLLTPGRPVREVAPLSIATAISVATVLRRDFGVDARVKWPNDIWVRRQKLAGILLESVQGEAGTVDRVIVGIGLNVRADSGALPPEVAARATSVSAAVGKPVSRLEVLRSVLDGLDEDWRTFEAEGFADFRERWRGLSATLGRRVEIRQYLSPLAPSDGRENERLAREDSGGAVSGTVVDISAEGALILDDGTGARTEVWHGDLVSLE
jgi:BirA family biotin operon repressor/biotin-[acetyl-CoA-carboxylase] ligase